MPQGDSVLTVDGAMWRSGIPELRGVAALLVPAARVKWLLYVRCVLWMVCVICPPEVLRSTPIGV